MAAAADGVSGADGADVVGVERCSAPDVTFLLSGARVAGAVLAACAGSLTRASKHTEN